MKHLNRTMVQLQLKGYNRRRFQNILIPKPLNTSIASDSKMTRQRSQSNIAVQRTSERQSGPL